jgi:peptidyl-prolyl cis-trans isomerase D
MAKSSSMSKTAVWILLGLLILGLAGFGATNMGGSIRNVGYVGDKPISTQSYFLALQRQMNQIREQTQDTVTFADLQDFGLDQAVLQRLVMMRALDHEATEMGLSVGDAHIRDQILSIDAFQSVDGNFDREAYAFALERQGLSEAEFESSLRDETARTLLQSAIVNGVQMPEVFATTLVEYAGEMRSFTWARLDPASVSVEPPTEEDLRAYFEANTDQFMLPVTKRITYARLTPEMLADDVELDEEALRQAYQDRIDEFSQPERRLVERLVFPSDEAADSAAAQLEVDGTTFEALVRARDLALEDVDMGDVGRLELDAAGEAVFGAEVGDVVGPLPTSLGPALFRVNGILPARNVSFEDALPDLREEVALDRARRVIEQQAESYDDLLAGGATLEELAQETDMELGQIDWSEESGDGIAAYEDFRAAAAALEEGDFPQIELLEDGGVFAMRLDEELPERPEPFEQARDDVAAALEAERTEAALSARAEDLVTQVEDGADFSELGLTAIEEEDRTRRSFIPDTPSGFLPEVFEMQPGDVRTVAGNGLVTIVHLDEISPAPDTEEVRALRETLQAQLDQALAQDIFDIFTSNVAARAEPRIDQQAVNAVNANFQ